MRRERRSYGQLRQATTGNDDIANRNGRNQHNHHEMPKRSWEEPLKRNEEGHGNQPQSHKAALLTNATRALWGRCEYHNNTHTPTTNIAARASIVAKRAWRTQTATFCQPAQESRVVGSTWWRQLLSPSAWPTQATTTTCKQQLHVKSEVRKKIGWLPMTRVPRLVARLVNLA
jgi:hypothetical protein